jgi:hypothetical protein
MRRQHQEGVRESGARKRERRKRRERVKRPEDSRRADTAAILTVVDEASRALEAVESGPTCQCFLARWARKPDPPVGTNNYSPLLPLALNQ